MATKKVRLKRYTGSEYEILHPETEASMIKGGLIDGHLNATYFHPTTIFSDFNSMTPGVIDAKGIGNGLVLGNNIVLFTDNVNTDGGWIRYTYKSEAVGETEGSELELAVGDDPIDVITARHYVYGNDDDHTNCWYIMGPNRKPRFDWSYGIEFDDGKVVMRGWSNQFYIKIAGETLFYDKENGTDTQTLKVSKNYFTYLGRDIPTVIAQSTSFDDLPNNQIGLQYSI